MTQVNDDTVREASHFSQAHLAALFTAIAPLIRKMSRGLCGADDAGDRVVASVLQRSTLAIQRFRSFQQAQNWFSHHTVLASRELSTQPVIPANDVLAKGGDIDQQAFIAALRALPFQQREAFILTHGQGLDPRQIAVAMDCSTTAAANHLVAATAALRSLNPDGFPARIAQLKLNYASVPAQDELAIPQVLSRVQRRLRLKWLLRLLAIAIATALAYAAWRILPMIVT